MAEYKILGRANQPTSSGYKILGKANEEEPINEFEGMEEPEGFFAKLPRNMLIGLAKLGHKTLNAPKKSVEASENILKGLGGPFAGMDLMKIMQQGKGRPVSSYIPHQEEHNYSELLGQKGEGTLMDKIIQGGLEYAPEIALSGGLARELARKFPITKGMATRQLKEAENLVKRSGAMPAKINPELLSQSYQYLPKTIATEEMLNNAAAGNYPHAFGLQSQLGTHQRNLNKSMLASERLLAPQVGELKSLVLKDMIKGLKAKGLDKEVDLLKGGLNDYRKYMKFKENVLPVLKKMGFPVGAGALGALGFKLGKNYLKD